MNIFEYVQLKDIETIPTVCKLARNILSHRSKTHWDSLKKGMCSPEHKGVTWGGSPGATALIVKAAFLETRCVVCKKGRNATTSIHRHVFYDVMLCNVCKHSNVVFRTVGFKTACRKFYLDPETYANDDRIGKISRGAHFVVLENNVSNVASSTHPPGALKRKMEDRDLMSELTHKRKIQNRDERMRAIEDKFHNMAEKLSVRICPDLQNFYRANEMLLKYNVRYQIYGDACYPKVTSHMTPMMVVGRLIDFVCVLTFMKRKGLLDFRTDRPDESCNPSHIFKRYLKNGTHYYETIGMYADAKDSLEKRTKKMFAYIGSREIDSPRREQLARLSCAEDGVEYDEHMFDNFVRFQVGNPVTIARAKRKAVFMNAHGYMMYYSNAVNLLDTVEEAHDYAEHMAATRAMGLPPMLPLCIVDY